MSAPAFNAVPIPKDPAARARLARMAGLDPDERLAIEQWCRQQQADYETRLRHAIERVGDESMAGGAAELRETP